jgi:hypothetical protein
MKKPGWRELPGFCCLSESDGTWQTAFANKLAHILELLGTTVLCPTTIPCGSEPAREEAFYADVDLAQAKQILPTTAPERAD